MTKPGTTRAFFWLVLFSAVALLLYQFRFADLFQSLGFSEASLISNRNSFEEQASSHPNAATQQGAAMSNIGSNSLTSNEKHAIGNALKRVEDCFRSIEKRNAVVAFDKSNETYSMVIMRIRAPDNKDVGDMMDSMSQQLPSFEKSRAAENIYRERVTDLYNAYTSFPSDRPFKILLLTVYDETAAFDGTVFRQAFARDETSMLPDERGAVTFEEGSRASADPDWRKPDSWARKRYGYLLEVTDAGK